MKDTSLAWHYRLVEPALAEQRLAELHEDLPKALNGAPVDVLWGHMVLELRPRGVSKALVVREVLQRNPPPGAIVAIGDDKTDEDMFAALPPSGVAIRVGKGATAARFGVRDYRAVRRLLTLALRGAPRAHRSRKDVR
jgi:trehalose 6-phosphate synthase/phosphatase